MAKKTSEIDLKVSAKDDFSVTLDRYRAKIKQLEDDAARKQGGGVKGFNKQFGEESEFGNVLKLVRGGGALAAVTFAMNEVKQGADAFRASMEAVATGAKTQQEAMLDLIGVLPVIGNIYGAAKSAGEAYMAWADRGLAKMKAEAAGAIAEYRAMFPPGAQAEIESGKAQTDEGRANRLNAGLTGSAATEAAAGKRYASEMARIDKMREAMNKAAPGKEKENLEAVLAAQKEADQQYKADMLDAERQYQDEMLALRGRVRDSELREQGKTDEATLEGLRDVLAQKLDMVQRELQREGGANTKELERRKLEAKAAEQSINEEIQRQAEARRAKERQKGEEQAQWERDASKRVEAFKEHWANRAKQEQDQQRREEIASRAVASAGSVEGHLLTGAAFQSPLIAPLNEQVKTTKEGVELQKKIVGKMNELITTVANTRVPALWQLFN